MARKARRPTPVPPGGQSAPVVISQPETTPAKLSTKESVLFDEVGDRLSFPAGHPTGQHHQEQLQNRGVDHETELISRPRRGVSERGRLCRGTLRSSPSSAFTSCPAERRNLRSGRTSDSATANRTGIDLPAEGPMLRFDAEKCVHFCDGMR